MDVTQIKFVIFDVGQTLLFLTPSSEEVLLARCQQLAIDVELEDLKRGCKVGELWTAQTIMQEQQGAARMSDEEFDMKWEYVVLEAALKDRVNQQQDAVGCSSVRFYPLHSRPHLLYPSGKTLGHRRRSSVT